MIYAYIKGYYAANIHTVKWYIYIVAKLISETMRSSVYAIISD